MKYLQVVDNESRLNRNMNASMTIIRMYSLNFSKNSKADTSDLRKKPCRSVPSLLVVECGVNNLMIFQDIRSLKG